MLPLLWSVIFFIWAILLFVSFAIVGDIFLWVITNASSDNFYLNYCLEHFFAIIGNVCNLRYCLMLSFLLRELFSLAWYFFNYEWWFLSWFYISSFHWYYRLSFLIQTNAWTSFAIAGNVFQPRCCLMLPLLLPVMFSILAATGCFLIYYRGCFSSRLLLRNGSLHLAITEDALNPY